MEKQGARSKWCSRNVPAEPDVPRLREAPRAKVQRPTLQQFLRAPFVFGATRPTENFPSLQKLKSKYQELSPRILRSNQCAMTLLQIIRERLFFLSTEPHRPNCRGEHCPVTKSRAHWPNLRDRCPSFGHEKRRSVPRSTMRAIDEIARCFSDRDYGYFHGSILPELVSFRKRFCPEVAVGASTFFSFFHFRTIELSPLRAERAGDAREVVWNGEPAETRICSSAARRLARSHSASSVRG